MTQIADIAGFLGGMTTLRRKVNDAGQLREIVRKGIPASAADALASRLKLTQLELTTFLHLGRRTVVRRKSEDSLLRLHDSELLVRLARIAVFASKVLGKEQAVQWLRMPNRALGGEVPLSLLDTELGAREVEDVLGRIEFGVYS